MLKLYEVQVNSDKFGKIYEKVLKNERFLFKSVKRFPLPEKNKQ